MSWGMEFYLLCMGLLRIISTYLLNTNTHANAQTRRTGRRGRAGVIDGPNIGASKFAGKYVHTLINTYGYVYLQCVCVCACVCFLSAQPNDNPKAGVPANAHCSSVLLLCFRY